MNRISKQPRPHVTEQLIADALLALMKQYPFDDITITQICQEAQVSRQSYYRNYNDKQEILYRYFKERWLTFQEPMSSARQRSRKISAACTGICPSAKNCCPSCAGTACFSSWSRPAGTPPWKSPGKCRSSPYWTTGNTTCTDTPSSPPPSPAYYISGR